MRLSSRLKPVWTLLRLGLPGLLGLLGLLAAGTAQAHKPSDSYLTVKVEGAEISGRWDIALRDLDFAIGLDADGDGSITWGELRARHTEIAAYAAARLQVQADGAACSLDVGAQRVDDHSDGAYTVLPLRVRCAAAVKVVSLNYTLFADLDPQHRGLLNLSAPGLSRTAILGPQQAKQDFELNVGSSFAQVLTQFFQYLREGVWHIWIGFDHVLFLISLLLPAVGVWRPPAGVSDKAGLRRWQGVSSLAPAWWDVVRIVTAFTVAHSITLSLAALGWVALPSRWVESAIAASVVLAALNNVWPLVLGRRWAVAFLFGLIHGFGFATVLADLGLPQGALLQALLGFNLGVELGQLAIVAVFLPLAYALRRTVFYRRVVLQAGSLLIAMLALVWLLERVFDLTLLPR